MHKRQGQASRWSGKAKGLVIPRMELAGTGVPKTIFDASLGDSAQAQAGGPGSLPGAVTPAHARNDCLGGEHPISQNRDAHCAY